jgi:thiamine-monophosphate kinase
MKGPVSQDPVRLSDIGEKRLISDYIKPLFNPSGSAEGVGDDCALVPVCKDLCVCVSTDRVPADLMSFKLGLIGFRELGQYLAVLNISDIAAAGGTPTALLLNLAFPPHFEVAHFEEILLGAKQACERYNVRVLGGDLSDALEMNLVATVLGVVHPQQALFRTGARPGDKVFCSDNLGIAATAFAHYRSNGETPRMTLHFEEEAILTAPFRNPVARIALGRQLATSGNCRAAMDVTDGVSQTFSEIAAASGVGIILDTDCLPIHPLSRRIASHYCLDVMALILGPAADFQLVGVIDPEYGGSGHLPAELHIIGDVVSGSGVHLRTADGQVRTLVPQGWNYYV